LIYLVTIGVMSVLSLFLCVVPLHAQTQAAINATARSDFAKADAELNKTYRAVLAKLPDVEKQKLKETQRAWIASRDSEGASPAKEVSGGAICRTLRQKGEAGAALKRSTELRTVV